MTVYCVSYDLRKAGQNYSGLIAELESTAYWHYLASTWLIQTTETATQLTARLRQHLDDNDNLLVIRVTNEWDGWLPEEAWGWIRQRV